MKKRILLLIVIVYLIGVINVLADKNNFYENRDRLIQLNIINENEFISSDSVTREECLISIMRLIGVTDKDMSLLKGSGLYTFVDTKPYSYIGCAYLSGIACGESCIVDYPTYRTSHTGKTQTCSFFHHVLLQ